MKEDDKEIDHADLVELGFIEALVERLPEDAEVLKSLGDLYTRVGRYEDGLAIDQRMVKLCPEDPLVWYNFACSQALLNRRAPALKAIKRAIELGYDDAEWMRSDADLRSLRDERGFKKLLEKIAGEDVKTTDGKCPPCGGES